jgi:hypothetical protein
VSNRPAIVQLDADLARRGIKRIERWIIALVAGGVPDLARCTATRKLCPDGTLLEVVELNGSARLLDREKLAPWAGEN